MELFWTAVLPADVVGLACVLQRKTVGLVLILIRADRYNSLSSAFSTCRLISRWAGAKQHPIAVFSWNLHFWTNEKIKALILISRF